MITNKEIRRKLREEKRHRRFINKIVYSARKNIRKCYYDLGKKAVIVPYKEEKWLQIKENIDEINGILAEENIRIELENYQLLPFEIRVVMLE